MANESMAEHWAAGGEEWVRNERIFDVAFAPFSDALLERSAPDPSDRVLEVGCGSGSLLARLAATGAETVGVDISPTMTAAAERRVPGATVATLDAQTAELLSVTPGRPFDLIVSRFGVMFFDDPVAAFANLRRAASPGAKLTFVSWRSDESEMFTLGLGPLAALVDDPPAPPASGRPGPKGLADEPLVRSVLTRAGWDDVEIEALDVTCTFAVDGGDGIDERLEIALGGSSGRALRAVLEPRLGETGWEQALDEVRDELRAHLVGDTFAATARTWLVTARNPRA